MLESSDIEALSVHLTVIIADKGRPLCGAVRIGISLDPVVQIGFPETVILGTMSVIFHQEVQCDRLILDKDLKTVNGFRYLNLIRTDHQLGIIYTDLIALIEIPDLRELSHCVVKKSEINLNVLS